MPKKGYKQTTEHRGNIRLGNKFGSSNYTKQRTLLVENIIKKKDIIIRRIKEMDKEYTIAEKIKDHWKLHAAAKELYGKDKCFICDQKVDWSLELQEDKSDGRMFNIDNSKDLVEEYWITICRKCLKRKILKELLESGIC